MMINTDIFLKIGDQHKVCEDYIIAGNDPVQYIILADGCSSSNNTEMGARILCHLAKQYLHYRIDDVYAHSVNYNKMGNWVIHNAELVARQLGLSISCLDATLLVSYCLDNHVHTFLYGDGVIITEDMNGHIKVNSIEFTNNAPYYLSYRIDPNRDRIYYENKNSMILAFENDDDKGMRVEFAYDAIYAVEYSLHEFKKVFVCSDGIRSFIRKDPRERQMIPVHGIIQPMVDFKNVKGEFLKRRLKRALKNFEENEIGHVDDLSIGAYLRVENG